jgi:hypothetical protein
MIDPKPITYRMLHEDAAGMRLCDEFFERSRIDPNAPVVCNCDWDGGHQPLCDLVAANAFMQRQSEISVLMRNRTKNDTI